MKNPLAFKSANTILYCQRWRETVEFYQNDLKLPITFASDWFVEFQLGGAAHLSVADEKRASIKSSQGAGITLALQVESADETWAYLRQQGLNVELVKNSRLGGACFLFL